MPRGRPKKYQTEEERKEAAKGYKATFKAKKASNQESQAAPPAALAPPIPSTEAPKASVEPSSSDRSVRRRKPQGLIPPTAEPQPKPSISPSISTFPSTVVPPHGVEDRLPNNDTLHWVNTLHRPPSDERPLPRLAGDASTLTLPIRVPHSTDVARHRGGRLHEGLQTTSPVQVEDPAPVRGVRALSVSGSDSGTKQIPYTPLDDGPGLLLQPSNTLPSLSFHSAPVEDNNIPHSTEPPAAPPPSPPQQPRPIELSPPQQPRLAPPTSPPQQPRPIEFEQANKILATASRRLCDCAGHRPDPLPNARSFGELAAHWRSFSPWKSSSTPFLPPLHRSAMLRRDDPACPDFRSINWRALLAGESIPPSLDVSRSEKALLERLTMEEQDDLQIRTTTNIDSIILAPTTLAVHLHPFHWCFCPPFRQRITQNPRIKIHGHRVHKLKQLRIGFSSADRGRSFNTHVCFPNMTRTEQDTTYVGYDLQSVWIDSIVLPAVRSTCPKHISARYSQSFEAARTSASANQELHFSGSSAPMDIHHPIPANCLDPWWAEVVRRANTTQEFKGLFLVLSAHDLKADIVHDSLWEARGAMEQILAYQYDMSEEIVPPNESYLDFGFDDFVETRSGAPCPGITLLRNMHCLQAWKDHFQNPHEGPAGLKVSTYPFYLTRDLGSMSVELTASNPFRRESLMAYHKSYNTIKDLSVTPLKDVHPFGSRELEGLAFEQAEQDDWAANNPIRNRQRAAARFQQRTNSFEDHPDLPLGQPFSRDRQVQAFSCIKGRLDEHLKQAHEKDVCYGARDEYRVSLALFRALDLSQWPDMAPVRPLRLPSDVSRNPSSRPGPTWPQDHVSNPPAEFHRPYTLVSTRDIIAFISTFLNTQLLLFEALAAQPVPVAGLSPASREEQRANGSMLYVAIDTMRLAMGGTEPAQHPSLMRREWQTKRVRVVTALEEDDTEADADPAHVTRLGLQYQATMDRYGIVSFPPDMILWQGIPSFDARIIHQLGVRNGLQQKFKGIRDIARIRTGQDRFLALFQARLRSWADEAQAAPSSNRTASLQRRRYKSIQLAVHLVLVDYNKHIIHKLVNRIADDAVDTEQRAEEVARAPELQTLRQQLQTLQLNKEQNRQHRTLAAQVRKETRELCLGRLTERERLGLEPLTFPAVQRFLGGIFPRITLARQSPQSNNSYFGQYFESGLWRDRLWALFAWDDHKDRRERKWEHASFRVLIRKLHGYLIDAGGTEYGSTFLQKMPYIASTILYTIPQFDYDDLAVMISAKQAHGVGRAQEIRSLSRAARTGWYLARIPADQADNVERARRGDRRSHKKLSDIVRTASLETASQSLPGQAFLLEPHLLDNHSALGIPDPTFSDRLHVFYQELDQLAVAAEAQEASFDDNDDPADDPELLDHDGGEN